MKKQLVHKFKDIICLDNLLEAWKEFVKGKRSKPDVQEFSFRLMDNIFTLHYDLSNHSYDMADTRHSTFPILNQETSTKQVLETGCCIMQSTARFIPFSIKNLLPTLFHAGSKKELIRH